MSGEAAADRESGQGTVEWIGLVLLVSLLVAAFGALAGIALPGAGLAQAIASKLVCAVGFDGDCERGGSGLALAYGAELAAIVSEHVPDLLYEEGMAELPVDYRRCREDPCSIAAKTTGPSSRTVTGQPATAFTRVIDCRGGSIEAPEAAGVDCSGERAGKVFIQYWLYWPDSQTDPFGERGYHRDDWESFQVRIGADGTFARASSHHSYNYDGGVKNWASDAGIDTKPGWGPYAATYHVSAGSHAGHVSGEREEPRHTPASHLRLIPIEPIAGSGRADELFEVTPPWRKRVYLDPESEET